MNAAKDGMIGSGLGQTAVAAASRRPEVAPRFSGFERMAFFPGAFWDYSWRETGITNGKPNPVKSGVVRVELSNPLKVHFGRAGAVQLFEAAVCARSGVLPAWWPRWSYLGVHDGALYAGARLEDGDYAAATIFDPVTGEVHPQGFMGSFSSGRVRSIRSTSGGNSFLASPAVVVEELFFDPEADTIGGVRICDGELHDYEVREFYLPGKGFGGASRSGTSIYTGGGYVDVFELAVEVRLTATNL